MHVLRALLALVLVAVPSVSADIEDLVDWSSFLGRHDPIWEVGFHQECSDVSGYSANKGRIIRDSSVGTHDCSSAANCVFESELACDKKQGCESFGLCPVWHNNMTAQLYSANNSAAADDKDWTLYAKNTSAPAKRVCVNTSSFFSAWQDGPFFGNGLVGGLFRFDSNVAPKILRMDLGRTDVWDRRVPGGPGFVGGGDLYMKPRLPIGHLEIDIPATSCSWRFRTRLYTAQVEINVTCGARAARLRAFAPSVAYGRQGIVIEMIQAEAPLFVHSAFRFVAEESRTTRHGAPKDYKPNPNATRQDIAGGFVSTQTLLAGGDYAVAMAWSDQKADAGSDALYIAIANDAPKATSATTAAAVVRAMSKAGVAAAATAHAKWWADWYPKSFLSIAQSPGADADGRGSGTSAASGGLSTALEGFYWIQMYKMASATRAEGPAMDLMGPWFQPSSWLYYWFDLNEQLQYWPVYTANRLDLGEGLVSYVAQNFSQLRANAVFEKQLQYNDSMAIGGNCPYNMECSAHFPGIVGDGIWICHNLFMQARYANNDTMLRRTVFPMLQGMVNFHRHHLFLDNSSTPQYHLPHSASPEYPQQNKDGVDTNFDIALLEWGLRTLLWIDEHLQLHAPDADQWSEELAKLTLGPIDPSHGYMVDSKTPFATLHRHFSHAFHIYPLHLVTLPGLQGGGEMPEKGSDNRTLIEHTLDNWLHYTCKTEPVWSCPNGYTFTGASSMSSLLGRRQIIASYSAYSLTRLFECREQAVGNLTAFLTSPEVHDSTMYSEGSNPVIESPLAAAASTTELLLTSWGGVIRIFPGVPESWPDVIFHKLLAEGGFEVSARRSSSRTVFVRVHDATTTTMATSATSRSVLLLLPVDMSATNIKAEPSSVLLQPQKDGTLKVTFPKAENTVVLTPMPGSSGKMTISALPGDSSEYNYWGTRFKTA